VLPRMCSFQKSAKLAATGSARGRAAAARFVSGVSMKSGSRWYSPKKTLATDHTSPRASPPHFHAAGAGQ